MKQLITFEVQDGENEYRDYGIYDKKYSDEDIIRDFFGIDNLIEDEKGSNRYWSYNSLVMINNAKDIDDDKIKIMRDYGVAYEHSI